MSKPIKLSDVKSKQWMRSVLHRAEEIGNLGEVPVSALVLDELGRCIGHGNNKRFRDSDPLGHAEIAAIRQASLIKNDWRLNNCTLIVNLEPCPMCAGALIQARMGQVIFGASDLKRGALGGTIDLSTHISSHHKMIIQSGVLESEARNQIENWFKARRKKIT